MSWLSQLSNAILHRGGNTYPNGGMRPPGAPNPTAPFQQGMGAQSPVAQPFSPHQSVGAFFRQPFTPSSSLSGSPASAPTPEQDHERPWWQNKDVLGGALGAAGGVANAVVAQRANAQNAALEQKKMDEDRRRYEEEKQRKQALADYVNPIYQRIMGQQPVNTVAPQYSPGH